MESNNHEVEEMMVMAVESTSTSAPTRTLAEMLLEQSGSSAIALDDGRVQLTFDEVDRWSNRLARALLIVGVNGSFDVGVVLRNSALSGVVECALHKVGARIVPVRSATADPVRRNHPGYSTTARMIVTTLDRLNVVPDYVPVIALDGLDMQRMLAAVSDSPLTNADRRHGQVAV